MGRALTLRHALEGGQGLPPIALLDTDMYVI
jgi:hypothetical protein